MLEKLHIDPERTKFHEATPLWIRAWHPVDGVGTYNVAELTAESLLVWLKSRGGDNPWAEDCVGILLGHRHLHKREEVLA